MTGRSRKQVENSFYKLYIACGVCKACLTFFSYIFAFFAPLLPFQVAFF